jgi:ABC-type dipeptide/oligopeptide/nickel transport system permease component
MIGGAAVVETIFSWPGIGSWAANSILSLDTAGILGFVVMVSLAFILTNFVADALHHIVDKRVPA